MKSTLASQFNDAVPDATPSGSAHTPVDPDRPAHALPHPHDRSASQNRLRTFIPAFRRFRPKRSRSNVVGIVTGSESYSASPLHEGNARFTAVRFLQSGLSNPRGPRRQIRQDEDVQLSRRSRTPRRHQRILVSPSHRRNKMHDELIGPFYVAPGRPFLSFISRGNSWGVAISFWRCISRESWKLCCSRLNWLILSRRRSRNLSSYHYGKR